jgi:glycosyltransferase involved in cell wall biosynthesis
MRLLPAAYGIQPYVLQIGPSTSPLLPDFEPYHCFLLHLGDPSRFEIGSRFAAPAGLLADRDIDAVVFNDWVFAELVEPLSVRFPVCMVCNSHQPGGIYYSLAARYSKHLRAIIGVSETITATLRAHLAPEDQRLVHLIRNGIEIPAQWKPSHSLPDEPIRLIYLGRMEQEYKRVLDLLDLAADLDRLSVRAKILLVGDGPDRGILEERIAASPRENVTFESFGHLGHAAALELLDTCDILLLMSDTEGLPLCLLEAAARGVVPVVTRLPNGIEDYFSEGVSAFLFQPGDTPTAARLIANLNRDRALLARAAAAARKVVEDFDLQVTLRAFARLIDEVTTRAA